MNTTFSVKTGEARVRGVELELELVTRVRDAASAAKRRLGLEHRSTGAAPLPLSTDALPEQRDTSLTRIGAWEAYGSARS